MRSGSGVRSTQKGGSVKCSQTGKLTNRGQKRSYFNSDRVGSPCRGVMLMKRANSPR